ncbi:MAG: type II toxin-antitoxin system VapC family toxin [Anaerosomatales bacterium]
MPVCVLDASVGVKWFRDEPGSEEARALVEEHIAGRLAIVVDTLFGYEVLRAASRDAEPRDAIRVWSDLARLELITVPLGEELVAAAAEARASLGCTLYDAFSAGLATLLEAPLCSADVRAHGAYPGVRLITA